MTATADEIVERRRLRRKLTLWRAGTVLALIALIFTLGLAAKKDGALGTHAAHVARVAVTGFIGFDRPLQDALERVETNASAKALVVYIDSPGGSTAGSEALYSQLRRIATKKPVVATIGALGASGAYIAAMGTDRIFAAQTSLVGSIGVLMQWAELDPLLEKVGVRFQEVKTAPLKAAPNMFSPASAAAKAALKALVDDSFSWFKTLVRERRGLNDGALAVVADGRVFTGRQALDLKLVDALGDERDARAWLDSEKHIAKTLPVRVYAPRRDPFNGFFSESLFGNVVGLLGVLWPDVFAAVPAHKRLDGLVSLWQPAGAAAAE